jgi:RNA polymerase sigma-32 factor
MPWIRAFILRFILDNWRLVRFGTTSRKRASFFHAWRDADDIAAGDPLLHRHVTCAEVRLDAPLSASEPEPRLTSLRAAEDVRPDIAFEKRDARDRFAAAVQSFARSLDGRDRKLFTERWQAEDPRTLADIGAELGVTRERVRQLERRILDRLQAHLHACLGDPETYATALAA